MTESYLLIEENNIPNVRSALGQATYHLETDHGFSPQEAREWVFQEARAKKATLEAVAKAVIAGTKVEYRAGQFPRSGSPPTLIRSTERMSLPKRLRELLS